MTFKGNKLQILAWCLTLFLVICLICIVISDRKKTAERNQQLYQNAQESEKAYEEVKKQQSEIYDRLYAEMKIPAFIFWGDNLMQINNGTSFMNTLNSTIDNNLFKYLTNSFHNVIEDGEHTAPTVSIRSMCVADEDMRQILARAGVNKVYLAEDINISSLKDPVQIELIDEQALINNDFGDELLFANQNSNKFGKVTISGIQGTLEITEDWYDSTHPRYAFVRTDEGDSQFIEAGTEVEFETASKFVGDIPIFYFEKDSGRSVEGFMTDLKKLVSRYASSEKISNSDGFDQIENDEVNRGEADEDYEQSLDNDNKTSYDCPFIIICRTREDSDLDNALENEFGDKYIRSDLYVSEMYGSYLSTLSKNVYDILDEQGCFSEIKTQIINAVEEINNL